MRWPWEKLEVLDSSYTDALVSLIVEQSSGSTLAKPAATAALEASSSIVARCFAAADVSAPDQYREALGPSTLSLIGRSLIRDGEAVFAIEIRDGRVVLIPAASWDVEGDADPASWSYRLTLGGPSRLSTLEPVSGCRHDPCSLSGGPCATVAWRRAAGKCGNRWPPVGRNKSSASG